MQKLIVALSVLCGALCAQHFEVGIIKKAPPLAPGRQNLPPPPTRPTPGGTRVEFHQVSLRGLILTSYHVSPTRVKGGPTWADDLSWTLIAKAAKPSSTGELWAMVRNLLAEQFKLQLRDDTHIGEVLAVTVDPKGFQGTLNTSPDNLKVSVQPLEDQYNRILIATACPISEIVNTVVPPLYGGVTPAVDQTGLEGKYDFKVRFTSEPSDAAAAGFRVLHPALPEALRTQLGLKITKTKGPVHELTIVHAEKPGQ